MSKHSKNKLLSKNMAPKQAFSWQKLKEAYYANYQFHNFFLLVYCWKRFTYFSAQKHISYTVQCSSVVLPLCLIRSALAPVPLIIL